MSVIKSGILLDQFIKESKAEYLSNPYVIQLKTMIIPLLKYFPGREAAELHHYLLDQGLFHPDSKNELGNWIRKTRSSGINKIVEKDYFALKKQWNGPEASIFIFPIEQRNKLLMKELGGKMGIGFHDKVILFLATTLAKEEISALFTHEYHHVCRLSRLNRQPADLTLLDSILIEGLAEVAVEKRFGKSSAPWADMYSRKSAYQIWEENFVPYLDQRGKANHHLFLYGKSDTEYPKWIGYSIGYHIVSSIIESFPKLTTKQLLDMDSKELLQKSQFKQ